MSTKLLPLLLTCVMLLSLAACGAKEPADGSDAELSAATSEDAAGETSAEASVEDTASTPDDNAESVADGETSLEAPAESDENGSAVSDVTTDSSADAGSSSNGTTAGGANATTTKKPVTTASTTKATTKATTTTTVKKPASLPIAVKWKTKATLNYNNVVPTCDGKNWIAYTDDAQKLIDVTGKVLFEASYMELDSYHSDRLIAHDENGNHALLDTSGKVLRAYAENEILFYGSVILRDAGYDADSGEPNYMILDRDGKDKERYPDMVGFGGPGWVGGYVFDRASNTLYFSESCYEDVANDLDRTYAEVYGYYNEISKAPALAIALVGEGAKNSTDEWGEEGLGFDKELGLGVLVNGKLVSTVFYQSLAVIGEGSAAEFHVFRAGVGSGDARLYGLVNYTGATIHKAEFQQLNANTKCTYAAVKQNDKWGFIEIPTL